MARWGEGSIAGNDLEDTNNVPLRIDVVDGEAFKSTAVASSVSALDQSVHTQIAAVSVAGIHFGVKFYQMPLALLEAIVADGEEANLAGDSFEVTLADDDGVDDIAVMAVFDYQALNGKAYTRGTFSNGYVRDVTMRFVSTGPQT